MARSGPLTGLRGVMTNPRLVPPKMRVFFWVLPDLSGREFRRVKQAPVARALELTQQQVSRALTALVEEHYLDAGPRDSGTNTYRLNLTHAAVQDLYTSLLYNKTA